MVEPELYDLVFRAKSGDKKALEEILKLFQPLIKKVSRRVKRQERHDLEQHLTEKIIRAVYTYNMDSIPDFSRFVEVISETSK